MRLAPIVSILAMAGCNLFTPSSDNSGNERDVGTTRDRGVPNSDTPDASIRDARTADMGTNSDVAPPDDGGNTDMNDPDMPPGDMSTVDLAWDRSGRVARSLLLYYTFEAGSGTEVIDRAPRGGTASLTLGPTATWIAGRNGVHIDGAERITGPSVNAELYDWVAPVEEITVEVWIKPDNLTQDGPARIVSFSRDSGVRNFTIGQEGPSYRVRLSVNDREFSSNGTPDLVATAPATLTETHVAIAYDGLRLSIFVNGALAGTEARTGGLQHWERDQAFLLGNENGASRPWAGEIYKLAIYNRALNPIEIQQNFLDGSAAD